MAIETVCQTPGTQFSTSIHRDSIQINIVLSRYLELTEEQAEVLEINIHNALELVLAPHFKE